MPPKRKRTTDQPTPTPTHASVDTIPNKKIKLSDEFKQDEKKKPALNTSSDSNDSSDNDESKPICMYDEKCYRRNPEHFKEFRHPNKTAKEKKKKKGKGSFSQSQDTKNTAKTDAAKTPTIQNIDKPVPSPLKKTLSTDDLRMSMRPQLEEYKAILKFALPGNTISAEDKRKLRQIRQEKNITPHEHDQLLGQFGWTADEYEDGEKQLDEIELDLERGILKDINGYHIHKIVEGSMNKQEEVVWAKATSKFYQTMSKAQANYSIVSVELIVNTQLKKTTMLKKENCYKGIVALPKSNGVSMALL